MKTNIAHTKYIPTKSSTTPAMNVEPLWKKVNLRFQQNDDATSVSSHNAHEKDIQVFQKDSYINQFLTKMHSRISQSASGGDSEIVDKLSIHWDQCEGESRQMSRLKDTSLSFEAFSQNQIMDELVFELNLLKKCQNMQQFLVILSKINPQICQQVLKERKQMEQTAKERNELLENQKRSEKQAKILMSQVSILENKNLNLIKDFERLKKEVDEQIILEEDRCKYKYQKQLQKSKRQMQSKYNSLASKFQLSTKYSISQSNSTDEIQEHFIIQNNTNKLINNLARRVESAQRIKHKKILPLQRTRNKAKGITDYEVIIDQIVRPSTKSLQTSQFKQ